MAGVERVSLDGHAPPAIKDARMRRRRRQQLPPRKQERTLPGTKALGRQRMTLSLLPL
jgi:hypothetical protein